MKVAIIQLITGRRLRLRYVDSPPDEPGFWCHEESSLIHPVGWAVSVGHRIDAATTYLDRCQNKNLLPSDSTSEMFSEPKAVQVSGSLKFKEGMKLEAVDPLNLDSICVATVVKVLRHGYLMIRIDRSSDALDNALDERLFCYHVSSACIASPGFCEANAITLKPPDDHEGRFRWGDYLRQLKTSSAPDCLFPKDEREPHQLRVGMRVEAADLMDPRLVCVATIAQVAGRLVRVHFDGWSDEFDQWMDAASPEIYPVGWCELSGYRLEQPVVPGTYHPLLPSKNQSVTFEIMLNMVIIIFIIISFIIIILIFIINIFIIIIFIIISFIILILIIISFIIFIIISFTYLIFIIISFIIFIIISVIILIFILISVIILIFIIISFIIISFFILIILIFMINIIIIHIFMIISFIILMILIIKSAELMFVNTVAAPVVKKGRKPSRSSRGRPRGRPSVRLSSSNLPAPSEVAADNKMTNPSPSAEIRGPGRPPGRLRVKVESSQQRQSLDSSRSLRPRKRALGETDAAASSPSPVPPPPDPPKRNPAARRSAPSAWNGDEEVDGAVEMILLPTDTSIFDDKSWNTRSLLPSAAPTCSPPPPLPPAPLPPALVAIKTEPVDDKRIPRLIDVAPAHRREALVGVLPLDWTVPNVAHFLKTNDCTAYCAAFTEAVSIDVDLGRVQTPKYAQRVE